MTAVYSQLRGSCQGYMQSLEYGGLLVNSGFWWLADAVEALPALPECKA